MSFLLFFFLYFFFFSLLTVGSLPFKIPIAAKSEGSYRPPLLLPLLLQDQAQELPPPGRLPSPISTSSSGSPSSLVRSDCRSSSTRAEVGQPAG
ncbi:hypothetical protein EUGRSUZ_H03819 [Eucalyptus grandis]|uniref:Uncharacterized protein n=2 Tax=Eucalyptus grandis TaxID=71139 RepID=A0ACC3JXA6_EUCGR|nr:hypothetical protein EUGRSUZ_H03819 [Eucalyptus grandis]